MKDLKSKIDFSNLPKHIAIIMDGNGRWAQQRGLARNFGHKEGVNRVIEIVEESSQLGIKHLTLYAFSTENWKRPESEINGIMRLLVYFIDKELKRLHNNNVRLKVLGDISRLPKKVMAKVEEAITTTEDNKGMIVNIALNYGARDEILRATKEIAKDVRKGDLDIEDLDENLFSNYLYTKDQPDPDLLIRASGELRISNFLLYQLAYSEFWFSNILWPDFTADKLYEAIIDYQDRDRRYGGVKDEGFKG